MALVRQLTTAGFRPVSKYEYIILYLGSQSVNATLQCIFTNSQDVLMYCYGLVSFIVANAVTLNQANP